MPKCKNKVDQYVVRGWSYVKDTAPCGTTDEDGKVLLCEDCMKYVSLDYAQSITKEKL